MEKRIALVVGATGLVGNEIMQQLLADPLYDKVIIWVRKTIDSANPKLVQQLIDFDKIESVIPVIPVDEVYCALGTTIKTAGSQEAFRKVDFDYVIGLGNFCQLNKVKRLLVVSAMGADASSRIFYNRVKGEMEMAVKALSLPAKFIFRPSLLMGNRREFRAGERMAQSVMGTLGFLFMGGLKKYKPIHARVVAAAMIRTAKTSPESFRMYDSGEMQELGKFKTS